MTMNTMTRTFKYSAALATAGLMALPLASQAACGISGGSVRILSNDFPALHRVAEGAEACAGGGVTVEKNQTENHRELQVAALTVDPAEYTTAVVANSSILPLLNAGLIRPLDPYVRRHGGALGKNQLITIDGEIMAVAFMANAQHLFYRDDILRQAGVAVPKTYEEVLAAAEAIRSKNLMRYPLGGTFKAGWNLAEEFVNMYMGYGGSFFAPGSALPNVNNARGVAALEMMKSLTEYMNPDFLTHDSNAVQAEWEAGNIALVNLWGSRAGGVTDDEGSTPDIVSNTRFAAAPTVGGGDIPATTLWWDGFTVSRNISDEDAEATFRAMANGVTAKVANDNPDTAAWIIKGYKPGPKAAGVVATAAAGAKPYPMLPYMALLHTALGNELADFMQGNESAEQALADVEAAYTVAAQEKGFL